MGDAGAKAAIIGWPVSHSRSPLIHRYWLDAMGLAGDYGRLPVAPDAIENLKALLLDGGYCGGNVTIPHKQDAFRLADDADAICETLGAANTLWFEQGRLCATNTDGFGFLSNLDDRAPGWDAAGGKAVILGAGGAARAIVWALRQRDFEPIVVLNRTVEKAEAVADHFGAGVLAGLADAPEILKGAGFVVNTTAVGMHDKDRFDFTLSGVNDDAVVTDIVYTPLETGFLRDAGARGLRTADGLGMLLHQAVPAFEKWFGERPQVTPELRALIVKDLGL